MDFQDFKNLSKDFISTFINLDQCPNRLRAKSQSNISIKATKFSLDIKYLLDFQHIIENIQIVKDEDIYEI